MQIRKEYSDFEVQYAWNDAGAAEPVWPAYAEGPVDQRVALENYAWNNSSTGNYTVRYGNARLALTENKYWNKQVWIRAIDKNGRATASTNITGFLEDTRAANIELEPVTPTDRYLTGGKPVARLHTNLTTDDDKKDTIISYRWVVEKVPGKHTWAEEFWFDNYVEPPRVDYTQYEGEKNQWTTAAAIDMPFVNGDLDLTMSNLRYNDNGTWYDGGDDISINGDVTLYVKAELNYTTVYKTVTFKVSDTAKGTNAAGIYLDTYINSNDEITGNTIKEQVVFNGDDNIVKLDGNSKLETNIKIDFRNDYIGKRPYSRELVDFEFRTGARLLLFTVMVISCLAMVLPLETSK